MLLLTSHFVLSRCSVCIVIFFSYQSNCFVFASSLFAFFSLIPFFQFSFLFSFFIFFIFRLIRIKSFKVWTTQASLPAAESSRKSVGARLRRDPRPSVTRRPGDTAATAPGSFPAKVKVTVSADRALASGGAPGRGCRRRRNLRIARRCLQTRCSCGPRVLLPLLLFLLLLLLPLTFLLLQSWLMMRFRAAITVLNLRTKRAAFHYIIAPEGRFVSIKS